MTRQDFFDKIRQMNIRSDAFNLNGQGNECYVLSGNGDHWSVYYSERGVETQKNHFGSESVALEYLLEALKNDPSAKLES